MLLSINVTPYYKAFGHQVGNCGFAWHERENHAINFRVCMEIEGDAVIHRHARYIDRYTHPVVTERVIIPVRDRKSVV